MTFFLAVMYLLCVAITICNVHGQSESNSYVGILANQMKMQQMFAEERVRSDGDSGLKQLRAGDHGTRPYYSETHSGRNVMTIHDHSNYRSTVGLAELNMVMNGVEFKTRHNDYGLYQPATNDTTYDAVNDIEFPSVPKAITDLPDLGDQMEEMRKWFKAWKDEDHSERDYRDYFKAVLVYMEGAWTITDDTIDEPFTSARHSLDAASWSDLHQKQYFTTQAGSKHKDENFAFLPTAVVDVINGSIPVFAQWNYRIVSHTLKLNLPLSYLHMKNDLGTRLRNNYLFEDVRYTRAAHYQLKYPETEGFETYGILDQIMAEIPGKNNYGAVLHDEAMGVKAYKYDGINETLNAAYYHRSYLADTEDEMGSSKRNRGYSDANIFMAMTDHPEIASTAIDECPEDPDTDCLTEQRWSYAVPLEIIYLTPLNSWNPHDIEYKGEGSTTYGRTVNTNQRRGQYTLEGAFNGSNSKIYYITPSQFFAQEGNSESTSADTVRFDVGVLSSNGTLTSNSASGIRVQFPNITGVGIMRQRYPIVPIHRDGGAVTKELEALKDIVLHPVSMARHLSETPTCTKDENQGALCESNDNSTVLVFLLKASDPEYGSHVHKVNITAGELAMLVGGGQVIKDCTETNGHAHTLTLYYKPRDPDNHTSTGQLAYLNCAGTKKCSDGHPFNLKCLTS